MKTKPEYTVAKLIDELKKLPQDLPVITSGYEGEYENILPPKTITVKFVPDEPWYNGQFQKTEKKGHDTFSAVAIEREVRPFNV